MDKSAGHGLTRQVLAQQLLGVVILSLVFAAATQADIEATKRMLITTTSYVKEQCNRYARIQLAAETKSLMRVMESSKQVSYQLAERGGDCSEEALRAYVQESYVTGLFVLDAEGAVLAQYHTEAAAEQLRGNLDSPALLDTAYYPEKRYAVRYDCGDGSEIDLAAIGRRDAPGVLVVYYHTPEEYIESFSLSIASMLSGYSLENDGTIVVSRGETVVASNDASLIGTSTNDSAILCRIRSAAASDTLVHARRSGDSAAQYFGLMERGREVYIYSYLPERNVFQNTPRLLIYALVIYLVALAAVNGVRWRTVQRYREKQMEAQREYAKKLQDKNEQLSVAVDQADRANAAKTSFLSRMSHDIRTPLNGIIGLLEIDDAHPDDAALINANRRKMRVAADHLLSLINDILQMSKLESGEIILAHEPMDLRQLSRDIMTLIEQRAADSGVTMENGAPEDPFPVSSVYGSPLHLRQIFLNIYSNCIKYNKVGGRVTTAIQCVQREPERVVYRWTITDTGIGMSAEFIRHIYDPFAQERSDARSVYQGTGLGMTIVKGLVDKMGGTIEITSEEGVGSTFVITLPFEIASGAAVRHREPADGTASIAGLRLLLAEDNELNAEIAGTLLRDAGAEVVTVGDGLQALERFESSPAGTFDAILLDMMMPVMDGLTASRSIRALARPDAASIPIIAMTANAFAEDAQRCFAVGMNAHLAKPLQTAKMIAVIARLCGRQENP